MNVPVDLESAENLYLRLREQLRDSLANSANRTHLVGVATGGAWVAQRLQADLNLRAPLGVITSSMHRDDFGHRGLRSDAKTVLPFEVNLAHIVIIDDVLFTGRTLRAVINELFDYGRPASVRLGVLVDRGGRELPIQADFCSASVLLEADQSLSLARDAAGLLSFKFEPA